jgi:hypothetical protein
MDRPAAFAAPRCFKRNIVVSANEHERASPTARKMMNQRSWIASALLLATLSVAGCGNRPTGYSRAYGKLLYKGEPAAGAFLMFQPESKPAAADFVPPSAIVEDDGRFEVASPAGDGAPPGKYKVLVAWPEESPAAEAPTDSKSKTKKASVGPVRRKNKLDTKTKDRLKGRYYSADTPLTIVEVKAEATDLGSLEIKD